MLILLISAVALLVLIVCLLWRLLRKVEWIARFIDKY